MAELARIVRRVFRGSSQIAERSGQTKAAFEYYKLHIAARDSLYNEKIPETHAGRNDENETSQKQALVKAAQDRELALRETRVNSGSFLSSCRWVWWALLRLFFTRTANARNAAVPNWNLPINAQINPHFIFNCLNSIYRYTKERDTDTATKYLKF